MKATPRIVQERKEDTPPLPSLQMQVQHVVLDVVCDESCPGALCAVIDGGHLVRLSPCPVSTEVRPQLHGTSLVHSDHT